MNPYEPPGQVAEDVGGKRKVDRTNWQVFSFGVSMMVVGGGVTLFRHLAQQFIRTDVLSYGSAPIKFDWLISFIVVGAVLILCSGIMRRN